MKNIVTAASQLGSSFIGKDLNNLNWMTPENREAVLNKNGMQSVLSQISPFLPQNTLSSFHPVNWAQALRNPPAALFERMAWAASVMDNTQAEVVEHRAKKKHPMMKADKNDGDHEAGELDENYNSPDAITALEAEAAGGSEGNIVEDVLESMEKSKTQAMAGMAHMYEESFAPIQDDLGIADRKPLTEEELAMYMAQPEHLGIRGFLLDQIAEQSEHFGLGQAQVADRFVDHMAAMLMKAGKGVADLQNLKPGAIAQAFDAHAQSLTQTVVNIERAAVGALRHEGAAVPPVMPAPRTTMRAQMDIQLNQMKAPAVDAEPVMDPAHRMDQLRLAAIKVMYPNVPQPANALNQKIAPNPSQSSHDAIKQELEHYAKEIGVGLSTMGKAADRFILQHIWPNSNPNHIATQDLIKAHPLTATPVETPKTAVQKTLAAAMHPNPYTK